MFNRTKSYWKLFRFYANNPTIICINIRPRDPETDIFCFRYYMRKRLFFFFFFNFDFYSLNIRYILISGTIRATTVTFSETIITFIITNHVHIFMSTTSNGKLECYCCAFDSVDVVRATKTKKLWTRLFLPWRFICRDSVQTSRGKSNITVGR